MHIVDFEKKHIEEATAIALENYNEEKQVVNELPQVNKIPDLDAFTGNGLGVAAFEGDRMVGFLCGCTPFDNAFRATDVRGVFSPMGAHGAIQENRAKIYAAMYQAVSTKWVDAGAVSHAICLYAHDEALQYHFFQYGFGLRCLDAIRPLEIIPCEKCEGYEFEELQQEEFKFVYPLHLALYEHYRESPFFMNRTPEAEEVFKMSSAEDEGRFFVARRKGEICAFVKIAATGETFVATGNTYRHIRGAYCLPEHRGKGLYQNLLNFVIKTLKAEGYTELGVDFESFNPTARGFWLKYFAPYTHSVVRRIDERILQVRGKRQEKYIDFSAVTACGECCVGCKKKEDGICQGCIESDGHCAEWTQSKGCPIHKCTRKHGVQFCGLCEEFPCEWLINKVVWRPNVVEELTELARKYYEQKFK